MAIDIEKEARRRVYEYLTQESAHDTPLWEALEEKHGDDIYDEYIEILGEVHSILDTLAEQFQPESKS